MPRAWLLLPALSACGSWSGRFAGWPDPLDVFPYVYTPETDLPEYATVRVETETWTPVVDPVETGLYLQKATYHKPSAPAEELLHFAQLRPLIPPLDRADLVVSFTGDVMRFDGNWDRFADDVVDRLDGVRVGNLETPVDPRQPIDHNDLADLFGIYAFNSPPELIAGLPLEIVQINNNHSLDLGDEGLELTKKALIGTGRVPVGSDQNLAFAGPVDQPIAFLSYTWGLNVHDPSAHDLHVIPFGHPDEDIDLGPIARDIRGARARGAAHVVLLLHWGYEYEYYPDPHFLQLGRELVALGADVIAGTGPHAVEPAEICEVNRPKVVPGIGRCSVEDPDGRPRTAAIFYSLGDFGTDLSTIPLEVGVVGTVSLRAGVGVTGLGWDPVASVPAEGAGQRLVPLSDLVEDPELAAEALRLDALLGTSWKRSR